VEQLHCGPVANIINRESTLHGSSAHPEKAGEENEQVEKLGASNKKPRSSKIPRQSRESAKAQKQGRMKKVRRKKF